MTSTAKSTATPDITITQYVDGQSIDAADFITAFDEVDTNINLAESRVSVSSADTHTKHLNDAISVSGGLTKSITNAAGDEVLNIALSSPFVCCGRLTLSPGVPVSVADITGATTLYFSPYQGNVVAVYNGTSWEIISFTEISISFPATTNTNYDVFVYSSGGTLTLELTAWTNDTTRATALTTQNGVLVRTGATSRRYVGTVRTATASGQGEDSATRRFVWNYYHRIRKFMRVTDSTDSWGYSTATWRSANNSTSNRVQAVIGVQEALLDLACYGGFNSTVLGSASVGIGEDSTTAPDSGNIGLRGQTQANAFATVTAFLSKYPAVGLHYWQWLEVGVGSGTTTWYGDGGVPGQMANGISGWIEG